MTYAQVKQLMEDMGAAYRGSTYNIFLKYAYRPPRISNIVSLYQHHSDRLLLIRNCNHFTDEFIVRLTGHATPGMRKCEDLTSPTKFFNRG